MLYSEPWHSKKKKKIISPSRCWSVHLDSQWQWCLWSLSKEVPTELSSNIRVLKKKSLEASKIWRDLHKKKQSLEGAPPQALPSQSWHTHVQANRHRALPFSPSILRPETSGCPSSRWRACCADGDSCQCCSVCGGVKLFVSPSLGPSVCCGSGECAWCCGSSSERTPIPKPRKRDQRLKTRLNTENKSFNFGKIWT